MGEIQEETNNNTENTNDNTNDTNDNTADITSEQAINPEYSGKTIEELFALSQEAKVQGNKLFSEAQYSDAIIYYTKAIGAMEGKYSEYPADCAIYFCNRAACYTNSKEYENVVKDCTKALELKNDYVKALSRRASAHESLGNLQKALEDYEAILKIDSSVDAAKKAVQRLPGEIHEKQEREKEEMLGKLKDLGRSILGKFNINIDDINFAKDPSSGNYQLNLKK